MQFRHSTPSNRGERQKGSEKIWRIEEKMVISDMVFGNLTTLYLLVIVAMKVYGLLCGRSFSGAFVLIVSTAVVGTILILSLTWDLSRKATYALLTPDHHHRHHHETCRGGICWHGVAVKSPASQVRFRLPLQNQATD